MLQMYHLDFSDTFKTSEIWIGENLNVEISQFLGQREQLT